MLYTRHGHLAARQTFLGPFSLRGLKLLPTPIQDFWNWHPLKCHFWRNYCNSWKQQIKKKVLLLIANFLFIYNSEQIFAPICCNYLKFSQKMDIPNKSDFLLDYLFSSDSICYYKLNNLIHFEKHLLFKHYLLLFSLSSKQETHFSIIKLKFCDSQSLVFHSSDFTKLTWPT